MHARSSATRGRRSARPARTAAVALGIALAAGCHGPAATDAADTPGAAAPSRRGAPEATSLLGEPLYPIEVPADDVAELTAALDEARRVHAADPADVAGAVWYGRRLSYLGRYRDAVAVYSEALVRHPDEPHLLRHRGHRFITLRRLDAAIDDLTRAASQREGLDDEMEPDGQPNEAGIPTSTLHANIYYHLGLAHYLKGDFDAALRAYRRCLGYAAVTDDMTVAAAHWLYMTLRRLHHDDEAQALLDAFVNEDMDILENHAYHDLLLMYRGDRTPGQVLAGHEPGTVDHATRAYGVARWYACHDEQARARQLCDAIVDGGNAWPAFGYIAAEADLARRELMP